MGKQASGKRSGSPGKKARRAKNLAKQPERKLRHILHRMRGVTPIAKVREAFEWANARNVLAKLRELKPDYDTVLRQAGIKTS